MSLMGAVSVADKISAVKKYLSGKESHGSIARESALVVVPFKNGWQTIKQWEKLG